MGLVMRRVDGDELKQEHIKMAMTKDEINASLFDEVKSLRKENSLLVQALQARNTRPLTIEKITELNGNFGYFEFNDSQGEQSRDFVRAVEEAHGIFEIKF